MKILEAVSTLNANGAVQYASRIIPELVERGHEVTLAALPGSWIVRQWKGRIPIMETGFARWPPSEFARFAALFREGGFDVLHSHLTRANNFAASLHIFHGVPNVAHAHENKPHPHYWFHNLLLAVSRDTLRRHQRYGAGLGSRGAVLPNFVDTRVFRPAQPGQPDPLRPLLGVPPKTPVLVQVGDICERKGQSVTLEALPAIWERFPDVHMAFIGRGEPLEKEGDSRVHWLGYREDVAELLPQTTIALQPSLIEPFGFAAVEAMACGVPLVASWKDGLREIINEGNAISVKIASPGALARAVNNLLADSPLRDRLASRALQEAKVRYSPEAHIQALLRHFFRVAAKNA